MRKEFSENYIYILKAFFFDLFEEHQQQRMMPLEKVSFDFWVSFKVSHNDIEWLLTKIHDT